MSTARYLRPKDWHVGFVGENFANLSDVNAAVVAFTRIAKKKKQFSDLYDYLKTTF